MLLRLCNVAFKYKKKDGVAAVINVMAANKNYD